MHPCIMLLDEPTAGLDPHGVDEMVDALERLLAAHTTVVIATHDVDFALAWADTVAVLHDGTLRHGDPVELLGDAELVGAARLRQPAVLRILAGLGIGGAVDVRDVPQLVDLLSGSSAGAGTLWCASHAVFQGGVEGLEEVVALAHDER